MPLYGIDDQIAFTTKFSAKSQTTLKPALLWTRIFHELAEAYEKLEGDNGNSIGVYRVGHDKAAERERILREQRAIDGQPYLKKYNMGAGAPESIIKK